MLKLQFDGDVLVVQPEGRITQEDVVTLTRMADEYLAGHPKIAGVMVETRTFPGFASVGAFADYARFIANHHAHVRRLALVTDSALAPVAEFMASGSQCDGLASGCCLTTPARRLSESDLQQVAELVIAPHRE